MLDVGKHGRNNKNTIWINANNFVKKTVIKNISNVFFNTNKNWCYKCHKRIE